MSERDLNIVGSPRVRLDGWGKVSGGTLYIDDMRIPGMWFGAAVRSPVARGRISGIRFDPAFDWSRVVVVTADDLPGPNVVAMIRDDHPILASGKVCFVSQPVVLIAAPDRDALAGAVKAVRIAIEEETPVLTMEDSLQGKHIIWGQDNIIAEYRIHDGDPAAGLARADLVIEGTYRTGHQEHLYLEPNGVIARPRDGGGIELLGSMQCPYYVQAALTKALDIEPEKAVVKQVATGGAFGGKEDFPSVLALHASVLALRSGHPVKMVYERAEDIRSTTKRHPSVVHHRSGVMRDGTLVAAEIDLVLDGGAYTTVSPVVLSRSILHASGAYRVPNISIWGRAVATNTPPNGAFRGFGAPQSLFAIERHMDRIARELGSDPLDLRRKNALCNGDRFPFGQVLKDGMNASLVLDRVAALSRYREKRARGCSGKRTSAIQGRGAAVLRGIGLSLYLHGGGFTGAGEERISGKVKVRFVGGGSAGGEHTEDARHADSRSGRAHRTVAHAGGARRANDNADGSHSTGDCVEILVSNVEMGQGASTVLCMIAAQVLGLPLEMIRHPNPDTSQVPDSGPTVASRTTMIVGRILVDACNDMVGNLTRAMARRQGVDPEEVVLDRGSFVAAGRSLGSFVECASRFSREEGRLEGQAIYVPPRGLHWDEVAYRGDAYKAYSWGADVVEVEIDTTTMEIRPVRTTVVVEIGRAINPLLAVGQVEGGTLQALGWGYMEEVKLERGRYLNDRMTTYIIPTSLDAPEFDVEIAERPCAIGPYGAKGLGELPTNGGAPALVAAIEDATGLIVDEIPVTPEKLVALNANRPGQGPGSVDS